MDPPGNDRAPGGGPGATATSFANNGDGTDTPPRSRRQIPPPREHHDPIADDKLVWFELRVPTWMLRRPVEHFRRGPVREARP
jgi:hypothetical protein